MSGEAHVAHPTRDPRGLPLLFDGCPRCEEQADELGLRLDPEKWRRAWRLMLAVEVSETGSYLSEADKRLGRSLYAMFLVLQRNTWINPERIA